MFIIKYGIQAMPRRASASTIDILDLTEDEAYETFKKLIFAATGGVPACPGCKCEVSRHVASRRRFRCKSCGHEYTVTSGTVFAGHKLSYKKMMFIIYAFVGAAHGMSSLEIARLVSISKTTAAVFAHKIRDLMALEQVNRVLSGRVEVDGCFFGGYYRKYNEHTKRVDGRNKFNRNGDEKCVVVLRQRGGPTVTGVFNQEHESVDFVISRTKKGTKIYTDKASYWIRLAAHGEYYWVNHRERYFSLVRRHGTTDKLEQVHINNCESFFERLRSAEHVYGMISGNHLAAYAAEQAWRHDHRHQSVQEKFERIVRAAAGASSKWKGCWQKRTGRNKHRIPDFDTVRGVRLQVALEKFEDFLVARKITPSRLSRKFRMRVVDRVMKKKA